MNEEIRDVHTIRLFELIGSLDEAAMAYLGKKANPVTGEVQKDLRMAQWNIDVLTAIEARTEGNLTDLEKNVLQQVLTRLRLNYVDESEADEAGTGEGGTDDPAESAGESNE